MRQLEQSLRLSGVVAVSISAMLGSGIFVLPGLAAALAGDAVWLAFLVSAACALPAALSKAELATAMPVSGGTYVYVDRVFGPFAGTLVGLALWLSVLLKSAFALVGLGTYLVVLGDWPLKPVVLAVLAVIVALNVIGLRSVTRAQLVVLALAFVCLLALAVVGLGRAPHGAHTETTLSGLISASGLVFVAYNGVTKVAAVAEEVREPERNLPLGILLSLGVVALLYVAVSLVLTSRLPHAELAHDLKPVHTLGVALGGTTVGKVVAVVAVLTMASMANAGLLAASRYPFAMSRDKLLPGALETVSHRFRTPVLAIAITGAGIAVAILLLDVERLAKIASSLVIVLFILDNVSVIVFREGGVTWYKPSFRAPLYPWLQGFGVLSGFGLLALLGPAIALGAALVAVPGIALFLLYGRPRAPRRGVVGQRGPRAEFYDERARGDEARPGLRDRAAVVVSLFGEERGPEMVVEVGAALAGGRSVQVVHLTEVPEQMSLEAAREDDPLTRSLRRRVLTMGEEEGHDLEFHSVASRDIVKSIHSATSHAQCDWLVVMWQGRRRQAVLPFNPLGWLIDHLPCNLALFRDAGVRYLRELMVFTRPGPHDALVVGTADELAQQWKAEITLLGFVPDTVDERRERGERDYLEELSALVTVPCHTRVLRGKNLVTALTQESAGFDLLITHAPRVSPLKSLLGTDHDRIVERCACSVLSVKTPRERTHEAYRKSLPAGGRSAALQALTLEATAARLELVRKDALFQHLARAFAPILNVPAPRIYEAVWERERTQNTSVGHGVALPHATLDDATRSVLGVFTSREPLDYGGPDGKPVDVFFFTAGPPSARQTHLKLLSEIARMSLETDLLDELRAAGSAHEIEVAIGKATRTLGMTAAGDEE